MMPSTAAATAVTGRTSGSVLPRNHRNSSPGSAYLPLDLDRAVSPRSPSPHSAATDAAKSGSTHLKRRACSSRSATLVAL